MQLNVYVPKQKARVLELLDETVRRTGRPKNEIIIEALERYLADGLPEFRVFHLGEIDIPKRDELYLERWDR